MDDQTTLLYKNEALDTARTKGGRNERYDMYINNQDRKKKVG